MIRARARVRVWVWVRVRVRVRVRRGERARGGRSGRVTRPEMRERRLFMYLWMGKSTWC